jgi:hypothetical protein
MMMMMMMSKRKHRSTHVYIVSTDRDCDLLQYRPTFRSGRTPHDKQNRNCPDYSQNLVMSFTGTQYQDGRTDGLTDCQLQSDFDFDLMWPYHNSHHNIIFLNSQFYQGS